MNAQFTADGQNVEDVLDKYDLRGFRYVPRNEPKEVTFTRAAKEHAACLIFLGPEFKSRTLLDAFTASALNAVYTALNEENRAKFISLSWQKMISVAWKLVK